MKNTKIPIIASILTFIIGISVWVPNLFFYNPDNSNIFIFFTPFIGIIGIVFSTLIDHKQLKLLMFILNVLVTISFLLVMFFGTLIFGT